MSVDLDAYIKEWLDENSRYGNSKVWLHYKDGRTMSGGMIRELEKAKAYAYGIIGVPDVEFVNSLNKDSEFSQRKQFLQPFIEGKNRAESMLDNKIAVKRGSVLDSVLQVRVSKDEKAAFFKAANGRKLSEWIIETLKKEAKI